MRKIEIPTRHSLLLYAALAIAMVVASYVVMFLLALACVSLPLLALYNFPNINTLLIFLGGIAIAVVLLWSLLPRWQKFQAPGALLAPNAHPRLFAEIERIANSLDEPMPRQVYLVAEPNAWVADRGGFLGFGAKRIMGLGLPLLAAL